MATWEWSGDRALLRRFDDTDLITASRQALALARTLRGLPGVADVIPGGRTVCILLEPGAEPGADLLGALEQEPELTEPQGILHEIPVRYDGADMAALCDRLNMEPATLTGLHSRVDYMVAFIGFSPGFPYLLGLPRLLHVPRLATPRRKVPAGSVAIAGPYSGIYPRATPGGWRLIGNTDAPLFDMTRDPPALLQPGDRVRFIPA